MKLEHAQDDLREASRKGTKAAGEASDAAARLQMAYSHVSMMAPAVSMLAPPASATPGGGGRPFTQAGLQPPSIMSPTFAMTVVYDVGKPIVEAADPGGTLKDFVVDIGKGLAPPRFP